MRTLFCAVAILVAFLCPRLRAASLSGSFSNVAAGAVFDLSGTNRMDWLHLGRDSTNALVRKATGIPRLFAPTLLDSNRPPIFTKTPVVFSWTNGTPLLSDVTSNMLAVTNIGNGFEITVVADTLLKRVRIYAAALAAQVHVEAVLSDASAPAFLDATWTAGFAPTNRVYTFDYAAGSTQQTLRVRLTLANALDTNAMLAFGAATLDRLASNSLPSIAILTPASNANVLNSNVVISTSATDAEGVIAQVEFYEGAVKLGEDTSAPFSFQWTNAALGPHTITARVRDDEGASNVSAAVTFYVISGLGTFGGSMNVPTGAVNLAIEGAADWVHWGYISEAGVNRKAGVTGQIGNVTVVGTGPYYQFYDNFNGYTWTNGTPTAQVNSTITGIYMVGLNNGFEIQAPADTSLRTLRVHVGTYAGRGKILAFLNDYSGPVYIDSTVNNAGNGAGGIYTLSYRAGSAGKRLVVRYTLQSRVAGDGNVTLQAATLVTENNPPFAAISSPTNGAVFYTSNSIPFTVDAVDSDGTVSRVEYFTNGVLAATRSNAPFNFTWINAPAGSHVLTARATDDRGATFVSPPVLMSVITGGGMIAGSFATPPSTVNLTAEGTVDWSHRGLQSKNDFNHRSTATARISDITLIGAGSLTALANNYTAFTWNNGTPVVSANATRTGVFISGLSNGFTITVPAGRTPKRLRVYAGLYGVRGRFEASLTDHSAAPYLDTSLARTFSNGYALYTVDFSSATTNALLRVRWYSDLIYDTTYGNVTWTAATLLQQPNPSVAAQFPFAPGTSFNGRFPTTPTFGYTVEYTTALTSGSWLPLTNVAGNGANAVFFDHGAPQSQRFYRVRVN